jgi:ribosomal protein S27AE
MSKIKSRIAPTQRPSVAYSAGRKITLAPLACPHCAHAVRAADAELHDDGDLRIVCGCCNVDILVVEKR